MCTTLFWPEQRYQGVEGSFNFQDLTPPRVSVTPPRVSVKEVSLNVDKKGGDILAPSCMIRVQSKETYMSGADTRTRLTARVSNSVRKTIEEAAELTGTNINQFMVTAAMKEAESVIALERTVSVSKRHASAFFATLERSAAPNTRLKKAAKKHLKLVNAA